MSRAVRFTAAARDDLERLFAFMAERDVAVARRALEKIEKAWDLLREFPLACRKATPDDPFLRELPIGFGDSGYVALYEIEGEGFVTVLAARHAREDDYH